MERGVKVSRPWPLQPEVLTPDDVVAAGACRYGVWDWMNEHGLFVTGIGVGEVSAVDPTNEWIRGAAGCIGSGSGSGYGSGYDDGDGSGYGYGNGSGSGNGSGYDDGYGYGDGYGDGYGNGDGSGSADNLLRPGIV